MSPRKILDKAKFLALPVKAKSRQDSLALFELELLESLLDYYMDGERVQDRVEVEGVLHRKASFVLVSRGLAGYVKDYLFPTTRFANVFVPLYEGATEESTHDRLHAAYEEFLLSCDD